MDESRDARPQWEKPVARSLNDPAAGQGTCGTGLSDTSECYQTGGQAEFTCYDLGIGVTIACLPGIGARGTCNAGSTI